MDDRILGLVGGIGPESTLDYYRRLVDGWHAAAGFDSHPRVLINSVDGGALIAPLLAGDLDLAAGVVSAAVAQLAAGGAGLGMIGSVATHQVWNAVAPTATIPMLSIVEATCRAASAAAIRRPVIFAPRVTVEGSFFAQPFEAARIELVRPSEPDRAWVNEIYVGELVRGVLRNETRDRLIEIAAQLRESAGADGLILGGTELSLILPDAEYAGLPVLNPAAIHVHDAIEWLLGRDRGSTEPGP